MLHGSSNYLLEVILDNLSDSLIEGSLDRLFDNLLEGHLDLLPAGSINFLRLYQCISNLSRLLTIN
jgi:hypothetical protein